MDPDDPDDPSYLADYPAKYVYERDFKDSDTALYWYDYLIQAGLAIGAIFQIVCIIAAFALPANVESGDKLTDQDEDDEEEKHHDHTSDTKDQSPKQHNSGNVRKRQTASKK